MNATFEELKQVPVRYWILAGGLSLALYLVATATPCCGISFNPNTQNPALDEQVDRLVTVLVAAAPLLAVRWVSAAVVVALLPALQVLLDGGVFGFAQWGVLVAVAMVATWRIGWRALLVLLPAMAYIVLLLTNRWDMVAPDGAEITYRYGGDVGGRLSTFTAYVVVACALVALSMLLRSSVLAARAEADLAGRSADVDAQAAVVGERARLARDLHDVVAHHVSLIAVRAETAPFSEPGMTESSKTVLRDIADDARSALDELRAVLGILRRADDTAGRDPLPGLADIEGLVERSRRAGDDVTYTGCVDVPVSGTTGYVAYRVAQEALTNARRHAAGQPVAASVAVTTAGLSIQVDNALPDGWAPGPERGLAGMRERVEGLDGRFLAAEHGGRFVVDVLLPVKAAT